MFLYLEDTVQRIEIPTASPEKAWKNRGLYFSNFNGTFCCFLNNESRSHSALGPANSVATAASASCPSALAGAAGGVLLTGSRRLLFL